MSAARAEQGLARIANYSGLAEHKPPGWVAQSSGWVEHKIS